MDGETVRPAGEGPWPAVFVIPGIYGINDGVRAMLRRLADEGYLARAQRWTRGDPAEVSLAAIASGLVDLRGRPDVGRLAVCGFCRGGTYALITGADNPWLAATVCFYGDARNAPGTAERMAHPLLLVHGDRDTVSPVEAADAFAAALAERGAVCQYLRVAGGPHAFFDGGSGYDPALADATWPSLLAFLRSHLAG